MQKIIGLWGPIGSGKTQTASILVERHNFREFSFASPLKQLAKDIFAFDDSVLYGPSELRNRPDMRAVDLVYWHGVFYRALESRFFKVTRLFERRDNYCPSEHISLMLNRTLNKLQALGSSFTPRAALQQLGTDFGRAIWDQVWVQAAMRSVDESGAERVVFSDCRFQNEAQPITERGGEIWWIDASKRVPRSQFQHASEATYEEAAPYVTRVLPNNSTLEELAECVAAMVVTET